MKYSHSRIVVMATCLLFFTACDKYLDVKPKGYTLLQTVNDYDQWLNDQVLFAFPNILNSLTDLIDQPDISIPSAAASDLVYTWAPQFSTQLDIAPLFWSDHYSKINKYNTVLQGIAKATGGTEQQKAALRAEALLGRAFEYLCLVNEYCQPYDSTTASKDPGVPFVTSVDVGQVVPPRGTVQQVYDQLITDIQSAIPDLPATNITNRLRPDVGSAYSILARLYLYVRDYPTAAKNAQLALSHTSATMLDYNNLPAVTGSDSKNQLISIRPDVLYGRTNSAELEFIRTTLEFLNSYDRRDIRFKWFFTLDNYTARGNTSFFPSLALPFFNYKNYGTSVQEMKLIIAEAAARSKDVNVALQQLNDVRVKRFPATAYQPLASDHADTVLKWVLRERLFEFPYHGLRWFDMRRLDKEGRMDTIKRYDAKGNVIAILPPHSSKYTLQIPVQVLQFNAGMQQNSY